MKLFSTTAAMLLFSAGVSLAAIDTDALISDLQAQGYTRVEVKNGPTQTKVEAIRGAEKVELVFDKETGAVLKSETEAVRAGDDIAPGVSVRDRGRDFLGDGHRGRGRSDDDSDDATDDVTDDDSDEDSDDDSTDDSGDDSDDDSGDDSDDDSGDGDDDHSGNDGGDDHGGKGRGRGRGGNDD